MLAPGRACCTSRRRSPVGSASVDDRDHRLAAVLAGDFAVPAGRPLTDLRDARTGELDPDAVPRWRDVFAAWWLAESDLRGWGSRLGRRHAVARGADTVRG